MVKIPTLLELSKAGVHLGHKTNKWSPQMKPYIHGVKNGIHIIDLEKTSEKLRTALDFIVDSIKQGKNILFIGTKPSAKDIIKKYARELEIPYVSERWLGGTLTNFITISKLIEKFNQMNKEKEQGEWEKYVKKERHELSKELDRLEPMVGGIKDLRQKPDLIYVVDISKESTAIKEAKKCQISLVAMVDTNNNPELIEWPIPANDDAIKSIELITGLIAEAVKQGRKGIKSTDQEEDSKKK